MGNDVTGIFCTLTEAQSWHLPGNTDKNYRQFQSPDRDTNCGTPEQQAWAQPNRRQHFEVKLRFSVL
jgi:hypothetical protein